ncbi:MAG: hypothetical protein HY554_05450 [Elusimicrobia bacterium]|nr:hypothetical protein [Elusimicrobiota bacterium]
MTLIQAAVAHLQLGLAAIGSPGQVAPAEPAGASALLAPAALPAPVALTALSTLGGALAAESAAAPDGRLSLTFDAGAAPPAAAEPAAPGGGGFSLERLEIDTVKRNGDFTELLTEGAAGDASVRVRVELGEGDFARFFLRVRYPRGRLAGETAMTRDDLLRLQPKIAAFAPPQDSESWPVFDRYLKALSAALR